MRATEDLLTEFFVNGHDGAVEQWEFGDYEGALEEIQSRGIDITKPDKRDAQEGRPGRIAIAPEGGGANRLGVRGAAIRQACRCFVFEKRVDKQDLTL
jgi:hypothetical protein